MSHNYVISPQQKALARKCNDLVEHMGSMKNLTDPEFLDYLYEVDKDSIEEITWLMDVINKHHQIGHEN